MDLVVASTHTAQWGAHQFPCAVGRAGFIDARVKAEGDGATPIGRWAMREVIYRRDKGIQLITALPTRVMQPDDGWCEVPNDPRYNQPVKHPYAVKVDEMWRQDSLYDIVVVLGYNDAPPVPGKGSAIFLHLARPDFAPSAGCVTLAKADLDLVVREADRQSMVVTG